MNNPLIPYRPPHQDWKSVQRFIPIIRTLIERHRRNGVANVGFKPDEMKINIQTGQARLRDAVKSLLLELTIDSSIDLEALKEIWPLYKVTSDGFNVLIVSRESRQAEPQATISIVSVTLTTNEAGFVEELTALALLLGRRRLQGQVDIIGDLSESLQHRIMSENDVVFISDGQQKHHMI